MGATEITGLAAAFAPGVAGFLVPRLAGFSAGPAARAAQGGALLACALAVLSAGLCAGFGASAGVLLWIPLPDGGQASLGARVDALGALTLVLVTGIGAVVARYSRRYLEGDPAQARFAGWLSYTLSAVLLLVVSSSLVMFFLGWIGTSHGLHHLLTHERDRPEALRAARLKFVTSRLGDLFLLVAFALLYLRFGTLEFAELLAAAPAAAAGGASLFPVALLLVLGAMTKSAQFPFHAWLPNSLETPTPVSALMHAGVINAGGFLLIRMSPLLVASPGALAILACGGAFTALLGSVVMLTQTDLKRKLAYSTVAQMGFMMLQCGLGAFGAAALHMVGHACFKAHAFLSSGSGVGPGGARSAGPAKEAGAGGGGRAAVAIALGVAWVALLAGLFGLHPANKPGLFVLGSILTLGLAQVGMASEVSRSGRAGLRDALVLGAGMAVLYFTGVAAMDHLLSGVLPDPATVRVAGGSALSGVLVLAFAGLLVLQQSTRRPGQVPALQRLAVHAQNGFYVGLLQDRLLRRAWPLRPLPGRTGDWT